MCDLVSEVTVCHLVTEVPDLVGRVLDVRAHHASLMELVGLVAERPLCDALVLGDLSSAYLTNQGHKRVVINA